MGLVKSQLIEQSVPIIPLEDDGFTPAAIPKSMDAAEAADLIVDWFLHFYSDPADETPYNSSEGGYQFVYGGPYDAEEEILDAFDDRASAEAIAAAIDELNKSYDMWEWAPSPMHPAQLEAANEFYEHLAETEWLGKNDPYTIFLAAHRQIEIATAAIIESKMPNSFFFRMLFSQTYSILEAFLFDRLKRVLSENPDALLNFSKNDNFASKISFSPEQILDGKADVKKAILGSISGRVFHRFDRVLTDYKSAIDFDASSEEFSKALTVLSSYIQVRHNSVHRNGQSIDGIEDKIEAEDIAIIQLHSKIIAKEIDDSCEYFGLPF